MYKKFFLSICIALLISIQMHAQKSAYSMPEVNKILKGIHLYLSIELSDSTKNSIGLNNMRYLNPLTNYIDYNVIGKGKVATLNEDKIREFIVRNLSEGKELKQIGESLINEYILQETDDASSDGKEDLFNIGGFFSGEMEYHQEPDGKFELKTEMNQLRIFFASHLNSKKASNNVSVFAEYNPVPEEVIHQVDEAIITKGLFRDTLQQPTLIEDELGGVIPFERLFVHVKNVGGKNIGLTFGQFRNPFGLWSDYTSHRNFSSTKNNVLVNGFALKKIELGLKLDYKINLKWEIEAALVNGRFGRTAPLYRDDFDGYKDFVTHITYTNSRFTAGASAYLSEFSFNKRTAYGIDLSYRLNKLLVSGEYVVQKNNQLGLSASKIGLFVKQLSSNSSYLQFDYEISPNFHLYGLYDYWKMEADKETVNRAAIKIFHGIKYFLNTKARWTILEYGYVGHKGFEKGATHLSTQLEINF